MAWRGYSRHGGSGVVPGETPEVGARSTAISGGPCACFRDAHAFPDIRCFGWISLDTMASPDQLAAQILNTKSFSVSPTWLNAFLSSSTSQRNVPISALTKTAIFRLLASDIKESLSKHRSCVLPVDVYDPMVQERHLQGSIPVQVLDIEDIGTSLWSQIEAIERVERGEAIRGREIVRTIAVDVDEDSEATGSNGTNNGAANSAATASGTGGYGPHRLILQDAAGTVVAGVEMQRIEGVTVDKLAIGSKLLLRNATVARGMVLLNPGCVTLLGGKIEGLDTAWRQGRKARLLEKTAGLESA